uniref:hypothetical protein n=1 Tax=Nosocomiicoccus ampullae TaxID=489910 RepID=UPI001C52860C
MQLEERLHSLLKNYESGLYSLKNIYDENEYEFLTNKISIDKLYEYLLENKDTFNDLLLFNELYPYDKKLLYIKNLELT